jgi:hypothetical protein
MSRDTTVIPFRLPEAIDDPVTEVAREGARRILAQVLIAEADAFVAQWKDFKLPDGRPMRQGARQGGGRRGGENPLHLADPAEVGAADQKPRRAVADSLSARGVDRRLPGGPLRPPGQGRA